MENTTTQSTRVSPKNVFLQLLSIITLYWSAASFITLLFQYINTLVPDPLASQYYGNYSGSLRFAIASLIIIFPAFLGISYLLEKTYRQFPAQREGKFKRWITYFTLFAAALIIIGDLVVLVYNFLGGDLTIQFILKSGSFLVVAGTVFGYYLREVRKAAPPGKIFVWAVSVIVAAATIGSFFLIGSPFAARARQFDDRRVSDLQGIQWQIVSYWQRKEVLPTSLADLADPISGYMIPVDPKTGESYGYTAIADDTFQLCATFETNSQDLPLSQRTTSPKPIGGTGITETWTHGSELTCFDRVIDPELYPPFPKN